VKSQPKFGRRHERRNRKKRNSSTSPAIYGRFQFWFPEIDAEVYVGGPVAHDTLHYIHDRGDIVDNSIPVVNGVYWGGDYDKLKFLIESKLIESHNIKFFLGYSGWSAGQLDDELEYGSWMISHMDANYAFRSRSGDLWKMITKNKGGHYTVIAEMPKTNLLN